MDYCLVLSPKKREKEKIMNKQKREGRKREKPVKKQIKESGKEGDRKRQKKNKNEKG